MEILLQSLRLSFETVHMGADEEMKRAIPPLLIYCAFSVQYRKVERQIGNIIHMILILILSLHGISSEEQVVRMVNLFIGVVTPSSEPKEAITDSTLFFFFPLDFRPLCNQKAYNFQYSISSFVSLYIPDFKVFFFF